MLLQIPLVLKEIESRTEDPLEKMTINKILQMKESSLRKLNLNCNALSLFQQNLKGIWMTK